MLAPGNTHFLLALGDSFQWMSFLWAQTQNLKGMEYCPSSKALVKKHILRLIACSWDKENISIFMSEDKCFDPTDFNQV